jgi:hypothetical protein
MTEVPLAVFPPCITGHLPVVGASFPSILLSVGYFCCVVPGVLPRGFDNWIGHQSERYGIG